MDEEKIAQLLSVYGMCWELPNFSAERIRLLAKRMHHSGATPATIATWFDEHWYRGGPYEETPPPIIDSPIEYWDAAYEKLGPYTDALTLLHTITLLTRGVGYATVDVVRDFLAHVASED